MSPRPKFSLVSLALILAFLLPSAAFAAPAAPATQPAPDSAPVSIRLSHGGLRLEITRNTPGSALILNLTIAFCDGNRLTGRQIAAFRRYIDEPFIYMADSPIRSVAVRAVDPSPGKNGDIVPVSLSRSCTASSAPGPLYCKNVDFPNVIYRSTAEPISFTGPAFIYTAGLRLPGVDGLVVARRIHTAKGYPWKYTLAYTYKSRAWSGSIPTLYIPPGVYPNVELVVQDGYGGQAKCKIGALTVKP